MREELRKIYSEVDDCLAEFDKENISILNLYTEDNDILKAHSKQKERLKEQDYHLLLAGNWHYFKQPPLAINLVFIINKTLLEYLLELNHLTMSGFKTNFRSLKGKLISSLHGYIAAYSSRSLIVDTTR